MRNHDRWKTRSDLDEDERLGLHSPHERIAELEEENDRLSARLAEAEGELRGLKARLAWTLERVISALEGLR